MEFYLDFADIVTNAEMFQFPTGWNSTLLVIDTRRKIPVSIPNGMEFYAERRLRYLTLAKFQFPTGWNSTDF